MIDTKVLRKRIIDLAVSGKLNKCTNKSAAIELNKIINDLGNSKQRDILDEEKWTDIPSNWTWTRLADLTTNDTLNDGNWVLSEDMVPDGEVKLIQLGSIGDCEYRFKGFKYLTEKHFKELNGRQIYPGYLLINRLVVDKMLSCIIPEIEGILITAVDVCWVAPNDNYYSIDYLMYVMSSSGIQQRVQELGHGVTRFRISKLNLIDIAFPMPPLDEQRTIVNKINELYSILSRIDDLQAKYSNDLAVLKSKIIDLGIRGKLTEQLPEDGDAETLYLQIQEEKAKLIKEGKIKKEKPLPEIEKDEIPFEIPKNWKWVRLGSVCPGIKTGALDANQKDADGKYPFFTCGEEVYSTIDYAFDCDAILLGGNNASGDYKMHRYNGKFNAYQRVYVISGNNVCLDYIFWNVKYWLPHLKTNSQGMTTRFIKIGQVTEMLIPLPPYAEQNRISNKIDELLEVIS